MKQILGFVTEESVVGINGMVVDKGEQTDGAICWTDLALEWTTTYSDGSRVNLGDENRRG
jgi:hypothetical protein